ncbi:hypothetical protein BpHYR1_003082 [Brachionus plicatilis]|uniref:Uncharacterized protein n=1 Tax=Brachionus plicatilis TaxID=10195 RepID=A0A3M7QNN4_BRAPC|nr:hypothetical protein BpHYR1_003082 [Brachionus plicatilis]
MKVNFFFFVNYENTDFLRCELERRFKDDANQTLAYYQSIYLSQILEIKDELIKLVPKNFKETWKKAANSKKMAKCQN